MKFIKSITLLAIAFCSSSLLNAQSSNLVVGSNSSGQSLALTNGTNAYSNTYIGYDVSASNNTLTVAYTNTLLSNSAYVFVGYSGSSNAMVISNGAKVINDIGYENYIGYSNSSFNNSVTVTGANSLWTNSFLFIGYNGGANSLVISNSGSVAAFGVFVGANDVMSSNNTVLVTGSNSSLLAGWDGLEVGGAGPRNQLVVSLGGLVVSEDVFSIGFSSTNNSVLVTGPGSTLNAQTLSFIGYNGSFNSLVISNGGCVLGVESYIGYWEDPIPSSNNSVVVTGSNSHWSNSGSVSVGYFGNANSLLVSNGGSVITGTNLFIGQGADSSIATWPQPSNNRVMVTGSGSSLTNGGGLYVGYYGASNALTVSDGGRVINLGSGYVGYATTTNYGANNYSASNNSVLVAGSNSLWSNAESLYVGYAGSSNTLMISNGGTVSIGGLSSAIGYASNSTGNSVLVAGSNSLWSNAESLYVGYAGSSNTLVISNGGTVSISGLGLAIGYASNSTGNSVVVTGTGSLLRIDGMGLIMGNSGGSSNSLIISEGGTVLTSFGQIGGFTSSNNSVVVTGAGSQWSCYGLVIGSDDGPSSSLTISNGGTVTVYSDSVLGYGSNSSANSALITGSHSLWSNAGTLTIGYSGGSGTVTVAEGGRIVASQILIGSNGDLDFGRYQQNDAAGNVVTPTIEFTGTNGDHYGINFNQVDTLRLTSSISGAGWVCALGTGTTIISGSNTYSLYTKIDAGTVVAASTNALGTGYLGIGGYADRAVICLATNLTVGDFIWGSNGVVALTAGSQTLTVANMTNSAGTNGGNVFEFLNPSLNNNTNTLINFSSQTNFTVNSFSIAGIQGYSFGVSATNVTAFIATNANLVVSDTIVINETLTVASLTIDPSGTLRGSGTLRLADGNLTVNGSLAPGNSPGTFYVSGGNLVMGATSVWDEQIYSASVYDRVVVTGSAFLNGTLNMTTFGNGGLQFGQKYNFLTASGGISGTFSSIIVPEGFRARLLVSGTEGNILIAPASYTQLAANRNQSNVATALNSFIPYASGDQLVVSTSLDSLTASQYQQAFNAIMPTFYQQIATIAFNQANALNMELSQRLWGLRVAEGGGFSMSGLADNMPILEGQGDGAGGGKGVLDSKKDILRPGLDNHWGMFVDGNGIFAQANSANMLPGYNAQSGGVTAGLTYKWNDSFASGIYCGYQGTYTKSGSYGSGLGAGSSLIDNAVRFGVFGAYGNKDGKGLYANALAGGAYHNFQATRVIQYTGMNRTANSAPGAGELDTMLATGYDIQKGKFTYGPTASLQYTYLGVNPVNETGAHSLSFNSGGWNSSSMLSSVGAHAAYRWVARKDVVVVPQISLNWQHEFMQNPYAISGNLGGTSPTFANWSATPIRDFLYTGVGFTVEFAKRWNTAFFYNAAGGNSDLVSQNIFWSAGVKF